MISHVVESPTPGSSFKGDLCHHVARKVNVLRRIVTSVMNTEAQGDTQ